MPQLPFIFSGRLVYTHSSHHRFFSGLYHLSYYYISNHNITFPAFHISSSVIHRYTLPESGFQPRIPHCYVQRISIIGHRQQIINGRLPGVSAIIHTHIMVIAQIIIKMQFGHYVQHGNGRIYLHFSPVAFRRRF